MYIIRNQSTPDIKKAQKRKCDFVSSEETAP